MPTRSSKLVKTGAGAAAALVGATTVAAPAEAAFVKTAISFPYVAYGQDIGSYHGGIVDLDTSRTGQNAVTPYYTWICRRQAWQMVSYPYDPAALICGGAAIGAADKDPSVSPARPTDEQVKELDARTGGADLVELKQAYSSGLEQARTCTDEAAAKILKAHGIDVAVRSNAVEWTEDGFLGAFGLSSSDLDLSRIDKAQGQVALDEVGAAQARCVEDNVARAEADYQVRFKATESRMSASEDGFVQCVEEAADRSGDRTGSSELRSLARDLHEMNEGADLRTAIAAAAADLSAKGVSDTAGPAVSAALADCGQSWAAPFYGPDGRGGN